MKIDTDILRALADTILNKDTLADTRAQVLAAADLIDKLRAAGFITNDGEAARKGGGE